jgi:hypothetical protein
MTTRTTSILAFQRLLAKPWCVHNPILEMLEVET